MRDRFLSLRWALLALAVLTVIKSLLWGAGPYTVAAFALFGGGWFFLSRRKTLSLDRERPGA